MMMVDVSWVERDMNASPRRESFWDLVRSFRLERDPKRRAKGGEYIERCCSL
jgi:hypothetical protein